MLYTGLLSVALHAKIFKNSENNTLVEYFSHLNKYFLKENIVSLLRKYF